MELIKSINKRLKLYYGSEIDGTPRYRVVFADDQIEHRLATRNVYSENGNIFLRTETGVQELKKYVHPMYAHQWILEEFQLGYNPELPKNTMGNYEPLWVFRGADGLPLIPVWKAVNLILKHRLATKEKKNAAMVKSEEQLSMDREIAANMIMLDEGYIPGMLHDGSAVSMMGPKKES